MEFLIAKAQSAHAASALTMQVRDWPQLCSISERHSVFNVGPFLFVLPAQDIRDCMTSILFDGNAMIDGAAFSSGCGDRISIARLRAYLEQSRGQVKALPDASGVFLAVEVNRDTGDFNIALDPLSQYNLFTTRNEKIHAFSNNIYMLELLLKLVGKPATRSLFNAAGEAGLGISGHLTTGIDDVSLLPPDTMVSGYGTSGEIVYKSLGWLSTARCQIEPDIQDVAVSLVSSLEAIHRSFNADDIVYDLTGGIDSRIVFAASRYAGIRDQLIFRKDGGKVFDIQIPDRIAAEYDLKFAGFPQNFDGEQMTTMQLAKRAVYRQQGQATVYNYELGRNRVSGVCRIRGGVGEIAQSVYAVKDKKSAWWKLKQTGKSFFNTTPIKRAHFQSIKRSRPFSRGDNPYLKAMLFTSGIQYRSQYFTQAFQERLYNTVCGDFDAMQNMGILDDAQLNGLFLISRSRRHFGYCSQALNTVRPTFEPLANIKLWSLASSYTPSERKNGAVVYDLLNYMDADLLRMPIHATWLRNSSLTFNHFEEGGELYEKPPRAKIKRCLGPVITDNIGAVYSGPTAHIMPLMQPFFDLLFSCEKSHAIWDILDHDYFYALYRHPKRAEVFAEEAQMFMRLFYGLLWVHELEEPVSISAVY